MDPFTPIIGKIFSEYGLAGATILLEAIAIIALYRRSNLLADQRVQDAHETIARTNAALTETAHTLETMAAKMEGLSRGS